ncbi:hypothetical protein, partial [Salmonella enterica]
FNKSKGVLITGLKLKAFRNPQPSWGFSIDKKPSVINRRFQSIDNEEGVLPGAFPRHKHRRPE